ncbi:hypothetical protein SO802_011616 [Lithocarpus litseifolius]|uniref:Uncharacterized protein n=1 Tax=Lithocarpus litseifolius TaxID=425828 RepID=A0AAW2D402_9ROSI
MTPSSPLSLLFFFFLSITVQTLLFQTVCGSEEIEKGIGRRGLLSFIETPKGSNVSFECSPSGPCISCLYSEKTDEKYRCSETGYRIPLKCVEIKDNSKNGNGNGKGKSSRNSRSTLEISHGNEILLAESLDSGELTTSMKHRSLLEDPSTPESGPQAYITYRSCLPPVNEEKLSVLGFEGIVLCLLLISSSIIYFRRKRTISMTTFGAGRIQTNSRF